MGRAAKRGIVIRSGSALERLASVRTVFFDKTGTLTDGKPRVARIVPAAGATEEEILEVAAALETACAHPLAGAILSCAAERGILPVAARNVTVHPGVGVRGDVDLAGRTVGGAAIGGAEMLRRMGMRAKDAGLGAGPAAQLTVDGKLMGSFFFEERLRAGAVGALAELRRMGLAVCVLTGDSQDRAGHLALGPGVEVRAGLSPSGKVEAIAASESRNGPAAMVGEGLNDAPALARCSVSISLGCGDGVSRDASDISLLDDDVAQLPWLVRTARNALRAIHVNLFWAFAYNLVLIPAAMAGRLQPLLAALAMIGSSLFVAGNSLRGGGAAGSDAGPRRESQPAALRTMEVPTT
jgi:cation transport ATPase